MPLIFVYGTLKTGGSNHSYLAGESFLGKARTVPGYTLYALAGYPGLVGEQGNAEGVVGEVWSVDDAGLARVDVLEGTQEGLYRRGRIALIGEFADFQIETYYYARSLDGCPRVGVEWGG